MLKDTFYRQILEALSRELDGSLFEACATDVLRERYPTLVPIAGGQDGGMDGAVADGEGEAFPLVCTTQKRVLENLTRNLKSYLKTGGERRKVVVATSRALSPATQRNLRNRARELEFTLVQVYERRAMAALLYRNSRWCRDLLDLPGKPAALTAVPPSLHRPLVEVELLGRDEDAEWLRSTSGDRILVGDPGAGKTYLLYRLTREGWGLFLASDEEQEIANAIRDQMPEVIIVDDAHVDVARLERLAGLRQQIGATFSIVATTWGGCRDDVATALGSPEARIRTLEPLARQQILQIFEELGVQARNEELLELVDQASNRPGLAATLAVLWLEGDCVSVLFGKTLKKSTLHSLRRLVGRDVDGLLAFFALGGRCGMPTQRVGEKLGLGALEMRGRLASLAAAGVLSEVGGDCLAVQPRALRPVLLSSVFFDAPSPLRYHDFLDLAPGYDCAVREIANAAARGARISTEDLQSLLGRLDPADYPLRKEALAAWGIFAGLGPREALWALEHYPGDLVDVARPALDSAPEATIQKLLEQSEAPPDQTSSRSLPPLNVLRNWLYEITEETLKRRRLAIQEARGHAETAGTTGALAVAFRLGCLTLRPTVEHESVDPTRTAVVFQSGPLPAAQLKPMKGIWKDALRLFRITGIRAFPELFRELTEWLRLGNTRRKTLQDEARFSREFVVEMLEDLVPLAAGRPGLSVALARLADELAVELPLDTDPRFDVLFPRVSDGLTSDQEPLEALANEWTDARPEEVVETLFHLSREAKSIPFGYSNGVSDFWWLLAGKIQKPEPWFDLLAEKKAPGSWLEPFLERLGSLPGFDDRARRCLEDEAYAEIGIRAVLRLPKPSPDLLKAALDKAVDFPALVRGMSFRGELPTSAATTILAQGDRALALAVAFGEWVAEPKGEIRPELGEPWRQAVLRATELESPSRMESYELLELLGSDPELAYEWLLRLDTRTSRPDFKLRSAARSALGFLKPGRRRDLLERLSTDSVLIDYLPELIDHDVELYRTLLRRKSLSDSHLLPLRGLPGSDWAHLARLALEEGYGPEQVAQAAYSGPHGGIRWPGIREEYWRRWDEAFASLDRRADMDSDWQEVIRHGREHARRKIYEAEQRSRQIERRGTFPLADPG